MRGRNGILEIEYGEYPQFAVKKSIATGLEQEYTNRRLRTTGKTYTTDSVAYNSYDTKYQAQQHIEYEYKNKKYVRVKANTCFDKKKVTLSNEEEYKNGDYVWIEVAPIKWLVDEKEKMLIAKNALFAGVQFNNSNRYNGDFKNTDIKKFMDTHFAKDIVIDRNLAPRTDSVDEEPTKPSPPTRKKNPYEFIFSEVSEEEIIKGSVQSGISVFLHGASSEGKSARVKQLDPDLDIIYLRNATPESLNGKSVYDSTTGVMIDVPPTWLKKLEERCKKEPGKIHIAFFDELTNALPSIQGMAYNIILDREVNGLWKLPENAKIVAAGNDMSDSLAANQLAEPLFNRFAHTYIKTDVDSWIDWALTADVENERLDYDSTKPERKIHPAVLAFISFKRESALRTQYNGETPNADPRKWEMASKMLYKTKKPEMLRALLGNDVTRDFIEFCNQQVITLEDVINDKYDELIFDMNTAEKWATAVGLSCVDDKNVEKVRNFISTMEPEFTSVFDSLWTRGDEKRLEKVAELRMKASAETYEEGGKQL